MSIAKLGEGPFLRHLARCAHETAPRGARQRTADADAADADLGGFRHGEPGRTDQQIDRLRMHRLDYRQYLFPGFDARRVEAIRARFRVSVEPVDHHGEVGLPDQKAFATPDQ